MPMYESGLGNDWNDIHTQIKCDKSVDYNASCCLTLGPPNNRPLNFLSALIIKVHQCRSKLVKMSNNLDLDETPSNSVSHPDLSRLQKAIWL